MIRNKIITKYLNQKICKMVVKMKLSKWITHIQLLIKNFIFPHLNKDKQMMTI